MYLVANQVFSEVPTFYILYQHHKTFRLGDVDEGDVSQDININASGRHSSQIISTYEASDSEGSTIALDQFDDNEEAEAITNRTDTHAD